MTNIPSNMCSICTHGQRTVIDAALASGAQGTTVARQFGLDPQSVRRHRRNHVANVPTKRASGAPAQDVLRDLVDELRAADTSVMTVGQRLSYSEQLRRAADALARNETPPKAEAMTVEELMGAEDGIIGKVIEALFTRLEPYPLVREAAIEDLRDLGVMDRPPEADAYYWRVIHPRHHGANTPEEETDA